MRAVLMLALTAGLLVSVSAAQDAALAMSVDSITPPELSLGPLRDFVPYAKEQEAALKAQERATLSAIENMAGPRTVLLVLLAASSMLVFLTAMQVRWSVEQPHVRLARRLGVLGLVAAALRTLDGAQQLVMARRGAEASGKVLLAAKVPDAEATVAFTRALASLASVGWTVLIVAMFFGISAYFRSPQVQAGFDATPDEDFDE
jgi:hypothetical protein